MRTTIRLVALVGIVAVAALALASLPALATDAVSKTSPRLNQQQAEGGIRVYDRRYDGDQASPQPIVPPDKDPKPGRVMAAPGTGEITGGFGATILGGGGAATLSRTDRVERSLRATADKLR